MIVLAILDTLDHGGAKGKRFVKIDDMHQRTDAPTLWSKILPPLELWNQRILHLQSCECVVPR